MPHRLKKAAALFCALFLCAALAACTREFRPSPAGLLREIEKRAPQYALADRPLYLKDGAFFTFYSLHEPDDLLLTIRTDDAQKITGVSLAAKTDSTAAKEDLQPFAVLLASVLLPECDLKALTAQTHLDGLPDPPEAVVNACKSGNDLAVLFRGETALCFFITYNGAAEATPAEGVFPPSDETEQFSAEAENFSADTP